MSPDDNNDNIENANIAEIQQYPDVELREKIGITDGCGVVSASNEADIFHDAEVASVDFGPEAAVVIENRGDFSSLDSDGHGNDGISDLEARVAKMKLMADAEKAAASAMKERHAAEKERHAAEKAAHDTEKARHDAEKARHDADTAKSSHWRVWLDTGVKVATCIVVVAGGVWKIKREMDS